jgi:uncharacterized protein (DUF1501 family)
MLTRRDFLKRSFLLALAPTVPGFLARTAWAAETQRDGRVLVVLELSGGNDGINTVVPFKDEGYAKHRQALRLPKDSLVKINDEVGLHPAMTAAGQLLESQRLAIVQGVGYRNPSRSHADSMAIWQTARLEVVRNELSPGEASGFGWLGQALDEAPRPYIGAPASVFLSGQSVPVALRGRRSMASALPQLEDFAAPPEGPVRKVLAGPEPADDLTAFVRRSLLDGYMTADWLKEVGRSRDTGVTYPPTLLARHLQLIARLLKSGLGAPVFYAVQGGYDTHAGQLLTHASLLGELSAALKAFLDDLAAAGIAERVVVLGFSEFGRRVAENGSAGTDHGTAGPVFLAGPRVKAGLIGKTPSLLDLEDGDLKMGIDFRRVYASVLEDWLGLPAKAALAGTFEHLSLFSKEG